MDNYPKSRSEKLEGLLRIVAARLLMILLLGSSVWVSAQVMVWFSTSDTKIVQVAAKLTWLFLSFAGPLLLLSVLFGFLDKFNFFFDCWDELSRRRRERIRQS